MKNKKALIKKLVFEIDELKGDIREYQYLLKKAKKQRDEISPEVARALNCNGWPEIETFFIACESVLYGFYWTAESGKYTTPPPSLSMVDLSSYAYNISVFPDIEDLKAQDLKEALLTYIEAVVTIEELESDLSSANRKLSFARSRINKQILLVLIDVLNDPPAFIAAVEAQGTTSENDANIILSNEDYYTIVHFTMSRGEPGETLDSFGISYDGYSVIQKITL